MSSLLTYDTTAVAVDLAQLAIWCACAIGIGLALTAVYCIKNRYTKSFAVTLAILPAIVCVVIALVNGNVGTGVAVAGAFSLVRFRSVPGDARDIGFVFLAMCLGLACGMGEPLVAAAMLAIIGGAYLVIQHVDFGPGAQALERTLTISVPEDLDFAHAFDDVIARFCSKSALVATKTAGMGSLYKLTFDVTLKKGASEKDFIDELRCRNGNLEISLHLREVTHNEL